MPIEMRTVEFEWSGHTGSPHEATKDTVPLGDVQQAEAAIQSFELGFENGEHPIWKEYVDVTATRTGDGKVQVDLRALIRDHSGNIDDPFSGEVEVLVVAKVA